MRNPFTDTADREDRNRAFISNYGEHYRTGERLTRALSNRPCTK